MIKRKETHLQRYSPEDLSHYWQGKERYRERAG